MSVTHRSGSPAGFAAREPTGWKRTILIFFHGAAATTFGFAIGYQSVSENSAKLLSLTSELLRPFGKWRYLTYNCLIMQFVTYSLCLTAHFIPRLRKPRDFMLTIFAAPQGILVFTLFWGVWLVMGRELIFPTYFSRYYPDWLNHVSHTIILPINLIELAAHRHHFWPDRKALIPLEIYTSGYVGYSLFIRYYTGKWTYPFLNSLTKVQAGIFSLSSCVLVVLIYKISKRFHDFVHEIKPVKVNKSNKKSK